MISTAIFAENGAENGKCKFLTSEFQYCEK